MAKKSIYVTVALLGIAAASGAAWWYQQPPARGGAQAAETSAGGKGSKREGQSTSPRAAGQGGKDAKDAKDAKPISVEASPVRVGALTDSVQAVGSLRSRRGVVIRPEVSGRVTQLNFADGQRVRQGQLLVQFDDQLQRAQLAQAQAELSIAQANFKRNQELVAQNFVSQRSLDESAANTQVAQAKLALARATAARLKILAPFDGIAGIRQVSVGDYVKDGSELVNIEDLDAMYVDFRLPERYLAQLQTGQNVTLGLDALPQARYTARIQAVDPLIDTQGRSIGVRACVDNRQHALRPGMFARVSTVFGVQTDARLVPEEAILPQGAQQFVIRLEAGDTPQTWRTKKVEVQLGLRADGQVQIQEGLAVGDMVVTTGQQRTPRDGMVVRVVDMASLAGKPSASPASAASASRAVPEQAADSVASAAATTTTTKTDSSASPGRLADADPCAALPVARLR